MIWMQLTLDRYCSPTRRLNYMCKYIVFQGERKISLPVRENLVSRDKGIWTASITFRSVASVRRLTKPSDSTRGEIPLKINLGLSP